MSNLLTIYRRFFFWALVLLSAGMITSCVPPLPTFDNPYDPQSGDSPLRFKPTGSVQVSSDRDLGEATVTVSWNVVETALRYHVQVSPLSDFSTVAYESDQLTTSPLTWNGAEPDTEYWARLRYEALIEYNGESDAAWSAWQSLGSDDPRAPLDFSEPIALQLDLLLAAGFQARGETHQFFFSSVPGSTYLLYINDEFSGLPDGADPTIEVRAGSSSGDIITQLDENRDKLLEPLVITTQSEETWILITSDNPDTTFYEIRLREAGGLLQDLSFPDPALQSAVTALTGLNTYVGQVTTISLPATVSDLTGIGQLFALRSMDVEFFSGISDLTPVASLERLQNLSVMYSSVTDLSPLSTMSSLRLLHLDGNAISDVTPLAPLTGLRDVMVTDSNVTSLSPMLVPNSQIEILWASGTSFTTVTGIGNLARLTEVYLRGTQIATGVGELATLPGLSIVDLDGSTLIPAAQVTALEDAYAGVAGFELIRPDGSVYVP